MVFRHYCNKRPTARKVQVDFLILKCSPNSQYLKDTSSQFILYQSSNLLPCWPVYCIYFFPWLFQYRQIQGHVSLISQACSRLMLVHLLDGSDFFRDSIMPSPVIWLCSWSLFILELSAKDDYKYINPSATFTEVCERPLDYPRWETGTLLNIIESPKKLTSIDICIIINSADCTVLFITCSVLCDLDKDRWHYLVEREVHYPPVCVLMNLRSVLSSHT